MFLFKENFYIYRNRSASNVDVIDPPLPEYSSLMQLSSKAQKSLQKISKQNFADSSWLTHVEVITYSGPHRRLWTGPQFSFGVYAPSGHSSAQLVKYFINLLIFVNFSLIRIMTILRLMLHKKFVQF